MSKRAESGEYRSRSRSPKRRRDRSHSPDDFDLRRNAPSHHRNGHHNNTRDNNSPQRKPLPQGRSGGAYIPPFKLAQMLADADDDKSSPAYQRITWEALRKSINGLINKVNASNIKHILPEIFSENLVRGRGLLCRSLMKSQMASPSFTPVYAALIAVINTKFPEIGELLLHRTLTQFKRSYKRNDKPVCKAALSFIAHLMNQQVVHEVLALEIALLLLESPSDDSVEVVVDFIKECGAQLNDLSPAGLTFVFDRLRTILHEGAGISTRTQYIIEGLFAIRKAGFEASGYPAVPAELDLVETSDQITHELTLDDELDTQMGLDVFQEDAEFVQHEEEYNAIRREILGEGSDDDDGDSDGDDSGDSGSGSEEEDDEDEQGVHPSSGGGGAGGPILDQTGTDLVNLRRTIYLTIMSALDFEEAGHKLLKMGIPQGMENELATMIIECCSQEKTFIKYYALLAERFCKLNRAYADCFADCFVAQYKFVHRLETNKLRNVAKLFAHLLSSGALTWAVLSVIRLTEEDTTSSSRIFIKILFQELAETMGLRELNTQLQDPACAEWFEGIFPQDSPRNMRFAINFFTSIGLGGLTDAMREVLKNLPRLIEEARQKAEAEERAKAEARKKEKKGRRRSSSSDSSDSSSGSDTSSSGSDTSSSTSSGTTSTSSSDSDDSEDSRQRRRRKRSPSGSSDGSDRRRRRRRSPSSSPSRSPPRGRTRERR